MDHGRLWKEACKYILGIKNLALNHHEFIRPIHNWLPSDGCKRRIFASLVNHLLAEYQIPFFMNSIWLRESDNEVLPEHEWYIRVSRGASIRRLDIPVLMTRKMEHLFIHAPDHFSFEEAIRYSQILGLGGEKSLAYAVVATRMGRHLDNDDFWRSVIQFFINAKELENEHVNPIVDFLFYIKFSREEVDSDNGVVIREPSQPDFSMKGRTFNSIMRLVEDWHKGLSMGNGMSGFAWGKSRFNDFSYMEESYDSDETQRVWRITELLSSTDLVVEGRMMRHCVSSYATGCFRGKCTIWSMKKEVNEKNKRVMTIEVDPTARIIRQARGMHNHTPNKKAMEIMKRWANREGLRLGLQI